MNQQLATGAAMARKKPPSFDFFADDFIAGTYHMEAEAVGIYIRLLCYQWSNGSIPDDEPTLCKIAGVDADAMRTHMRSVMRKLCVGNAGELYNERMEIERAKKLEIIEKAKRSAEQRWTKEKKGKTETDPKNDGCGRNANAYANAMPTQCSLLPTSNVLLPNDYNTHTLPARGCPSASRSSPRSIACMPCPQPHCPLTLRGALHKRLANCYVASFALHPCECLLCGAYLLTAWHASRHAVVRIARTTDALPCIVR